jgi:hypothetical protein
MRAWPRRPAVAVAAVRPSLSQPVAAEEAPAESPSFMDVLGTSSFSRLRTDILLVALSFCVTAYIAALLVRPRTSTWVACGAIIAVMAFPVVAAQLAIDPQQPPAVFRILEVPPFAFSGAAVAAALVGDWLAKVVITRSRRSLR